MVTRSRWRRPPSRPSAYRATTRLAGTLVVGSIVYAGLGLHSLLLWPDEVFRGALWQPFTYGFIERSPLEVLISAVILVSVGGSLESWWGAARVTRLLVGVTVGSGIGTLLLAVPFGAMRHAGFAGGGAMAGAAWVAYGWTLGGSLASFWGITVTGNQLAGIGIGMVVLHAAYHSVVFAVPEAMAIAMTWLHLRHRR